MEDQNTRALIKLYRRTKSPVALDVLVRNHQAALKLCANDTPHNIMAFDDKIQFGNLILLKLISGKFDLRHKIKFNTFLINHTKFRILDEIRKLQRRSAASLDDTRSVEHHENLYETFENKELREQLVQEIQKLPRTEQIVMGCLLEGFNQTQIADQAGVTASRISQIVNKSIKTLRVNLSNN